MPTMNKNIEPKFSTMFCESYPRRLYCSSDSDEEKENKSDLICSVGMMSKLEMSMMKL
jgi:hypothetical protein